MRCNEAAERRRFAISAHWRIRLAPWALIAPAGFFLGILILACLMIFRLSFGIKGMEWSIWTLQNYRELGQSLYLKSILLTFKLAFLTAFFVVVLGYPIAMFMNQTRSGKVRLVITFIMILPLFVNLLFQSYGWIILLSPAGLLNQILLDLSLIKQPLSLLFNQNGVLLGLIQTSFPLAVLPIASSLHNIPNSLEEAASTLGASRFRVLWHIVLPLSLPGVVAGSLLVFAYNVSAFVIPHLVGGRRVSMLSILIRDEMGPMLNWPFGSAASMVLVAITIAILTIYQLIAARFLKQ